jgi:hypothetical protein
MPASLDEHLTNLRAEGVAFDSYVRSGDREEGLLTSGGKTPTRCCSREQRRLHDYWSRLEPSYRARIEQLAHALPPIREQCRLVVQIVARLEERCLPRCLRAFLEQRDRSWSMLETDLYEILIVNNVDAGTEADESEAVVTRIKHEYGVRARNVHLVSVVFDQDEPYPLTLARRYAADITIARLLARPTYPSPMYFALEDADLEWLDPRQVATQIAVLDEQPALDAVRGQQDRCPWIMAQHDLLLLLRRSWNFTESYLTRHSLRPERNPHYNFNWNRVVTSGWNTAITAEAFALINGYTRHRRIGEDVDLGERISCVRGHEVANGFLPQMGTVAKVNIRAEGSPRRWLLRVAEQVEPYERKQGYANFFSRETSTRLRDTSYIDMLDQARLSARIAPSNLHLFEEVLTKDWRFTLRVRHTVEAARAQFRFVMTMLGFSRDDWTYENDTIRVRRLDAIATRLEAYRQRSAGAGPILGTPSAASRGRRVTWRSFIV